MDSLNPGIYSKNHWAIAENSLTPQMKFKMSDIHCEIDFELFGNQS